MNYFRIKSFVWSKSFASEVEIEVIQQRKIPYLQIIGAGEGSKQSQRERILAAIESTGIRLPSRRFVVQVKGSGIFSREGLDLPIALAILGSAGHFSEQKIANSIFLGSLALDGRLICPPVERDFPVQAADSAFIGPLEIKKHLNNSVGGHFFADLSSVLEFLKKIPRICPEKTEVLTKNTDYRKIQHRSRLNHHVFLSLCGGFPLFLMDANAQEVGEVAHWMRELNEELEKCQSRQKNLSKSIRLEPSIGVIHGEQYRTFPKILQSIGWSESPDPEKKSLVCFLDLERNIGKVAPWLEERRFGEIYRLGRWQNGGGLGLNILGSGFSCFCRQQLKCMCRSSETRIHQRNIRFIAGHFPVFYFWNKSEESRISRQFTFEEMKCARELALSRQGYENWNIPNAEIKTVKTWEFRADQLFRWMKSKLSSDEAGFVAKIAITLADIKGADRVEEQDLLEAIGYTSNFEGSEFSSGMNLVKASAPVRNSTEIP